MAPCMVALMGPVLVTQSSNNAKSISSPSLSEVTIRQGRTRYLAQD